MRRDPPAGRPLARAFGALVLLIVCSGAAEIAVLLVQQRAVRQLTTHVQPLELANTRLRVLLADAQRGLRGYLLTADGRLLDTYLMARSGYPVAVQDVRDLATAGESGEVNRQVSDADGWWALAERQRQAQPRSDAAVAYVSQGEPLFEAFRSANGDFDVALATRTASLRRESGQLGALAAGLVIALTLVAALLVTRAAGRANRLVAEPPSLAARLRELDTAKTDFMSTVSHELRTPLTSIAGYVELLLDAEGGELRPAQQRMLEAVDRNTRRLRELIEDMLILSQIESGAFRTAKDQVDVAALVETAVAAIAPAAAKASVGLHTEVYGPLPLDADPEQIDRLLVNLLENAVKFTPADGTVTVAGRREDDTVVIAVADTGMGIPKAEQQALFVRFFRASNAIYQAVPGTGLGLTIVRTIVDNHGGQIEVESAEGVGTTVTVRLPAGPMQPGG